MILDGIDFGYVFNASGARGLLGEGYPWHRLWRHLGLNYEHATFVSKTVTCWPRKGNMPLRGSEDDFRPRELLPACVVVRPLKGVVLNAVGLSNPGVFALLPRWRDALPKGRPWVVSVMPVTSDPVEELLAFALALRDWRDRLPPFAIQLNVSCPNVGHMVAVDWSNIDRQLWVLSYANVPIMIKMNALMPPIIATALDGDPRVKALVVSNTIPWGELPGRIDWEGLFRSKTSPLAHLGGGGLSGRPLLPIVCDWIRSARAAGVEKPIIGGGGVLSVDDARRVIDAGASAIELGCVSILRPWRVRSIVRYASLRRGCEELVARRQKSAASAASEGSVS